MLRTMRMAALALAMTLLLSGFALAYDDNDRYYCGAGNGSQARQYGYQNGYRDGVNRGRHEGREHDRYDGREVDWRQSTRGYQSWMGPVNLYRSAYQDGYRNGFQEAYRSASRDDGSYRDGYYRNDSYNPGWYRGGYEPRGLQLWISGWRHRCARRSIQAQAVQSRTTGKYDDRDHGYRREYGDKNSYRATYSEGYRAGYERE